MVKCPNCGKALECTDMYDMDLFAEDKWLEHCEGFCPHCNKNYTWKEIYQRISVEEIKEIKEEE